jgi:hypothetical protein
VLTVARLMGGMSAIQPRQAHDRPSEQEVVGTEKVRAQRARAVEQVERGYRVRCMVCEKTGPTRKTSEAARKALLVLGVQDSRLWHQGK